jgi:hypothetical protein
MVNPKKDKREKIINRRIFILFLINVGLLAIELIFFRGLPESILQRILYIFAGICYGINIFLLASLYNPQPIIDPRGHEWNNSLKNKVLVAMMSLIFLLYGFVSFAIYLFLHIRAS